MSFNAFPLLAVAVLALLCTAAPAAATVYYSQQEALASAFPDADRVDRRTFVLTRAQVSTVEKLARSPLQSQIVTVYVARKSDRLLGYALIDVHTVRTLPEALLVVLTPGGAVRSVWVLAFHEPTEYQPTKRWFGQFEGWELGPTLRLHRGIDAVTGATLSAQATTHSVRRALALHRVLFETSAME